MIYDRKRVIAKCVVDPILIFLLVIVNGFFDWAPFISPTMRGIFCNDESISYPFINSVYSFWILLLISIIFPIIIIITTELIHGDNGRPLEYGDTKIPSWTWKTYCFLTNYFFGYFVNSIITHIIKFTIGRPRPYFLDVCRPKINCTLSKNLYVYHERVKCTGLGLILDGSVVTEEHLKQIRLSFPSGHASFTMYTSIWLTIFLQARFTWKSTFMVKNFFQFTLILFSLFTGVSRIAEYQHHWSDVLAGFIIGGLTAILVTLWGGNMFSEKENQYLEIEDVDVTSEFNKFLDNFYKNITPRK